MTTPSDSEGPEHLNLAQNPSDMTLQVEEEQNALIDPQQPSKTLNLEPPDPQGSPSQPDSQPHLPEYHLNDQDQDVPDEIMDLSRSSDAQATISTSNANFTNVTRRGSKRKKLPQKLAQKRRFAHEKSQKKLDILVDTFKPIPFVPGKSLSFSSHEKLLKRLGLWDFVHIEFDRTIRHDLLLQLVASFNSSQKISYVNGVRIMVNRPGLARALRLPLKKHMVVDDADEIEASEDSITFIEEILSNWVLLHEDTWMMPSEILNFTKVIKEGNFEKFDCAGLIWFMVEKELMQAPHLVNCYYASHLQCLIRSQREDLFREEEDTFMEEEYGNEDVKVEEQEDEEYGNEDVKVGGNDDFQDCKLEEHNIELSLGQDTVEKAEEVEKERVENEDLMDFVVDTEEEPEKLLLDGKSVAEPFMRRCSFVELKGIEYEEEPRGEEEEQGEGEGEGEDADENEGRFHLSPKSNAIDGFSSGNFIQETDAMQMPFSSGLEIRNHSPVEFLSSRDDNRMAPPGGSLFLGNSHKRRNDHDDENFHNQSLNGGDKRLKSALPEYDMCMDQIQHWVVKARMALVNKEQHNYEQYAMDQQYLLHELQQRNNFIEHLQKTKFEEQQKKQAEIYRLERELYMMENLLEGYRKALKATNKAFSEYRARCSQADEPLFKDVSGSGGLVLSTTELERIRLKKEEEDRLSRSVIEKTFKDLEEGFIGVFETRLQEVSLLDDKIIDLEEKVKLLKESFAERGASLKTVEDPPNE